MRENDLAESQRLTERWGVPHRELMQMSAAPAFFNAWRNGWEKRRGEVLFLLPRPGGLLLHRKHVYPPEVWRFPTGGIDAGEGIEQALWRELREEVGLPLTVQHYLAVLFYEVEVEGRTHDFATHLFLMSPSDASLCGSEDEFSATRVAPLSDLPAVAATLEHLATPWDDWGLFRARAHRLVHRVLTARWERNLGLR